MTSRGPGPDSTHSGSSDEDSTLRCDRCQESMKLSACHGIWFRHGSPMTKNSSFTVCDDCEDEFRQFMSGGWVIDPEMQEGP